MEKKVWENFHWNIVGWTFAISASPSPNLSKMTVKGFFKLKWTGKERGEQWSLGSQKTGWVRTVPGKKPAMEKAESNLISSQNPLPPLQTSVTGHSRGLGRQGRRRTNTRIGWKSVWEAPRHARYLPCSLQPSDCPSPSPQEEADFILSRMVSGQHPRPYWKDNVPVSFHSLKPLASYLDPHNDGRQIFTLQADDGTSLLWKTWSAQGQKRWKDLWEVPSRMAQLQPN